MISSYRFLRLLHLRLLFCTTSILTSSVVSEFEEYGFERVSDIGPWLVELKEFQINMPKGPFLRGSNYTGLDIAENLYEIMSRDFNTDFDEALEKASDNDDGLDDTGFDDDLFLGQDDDLDKGYRWIYNTTNINYTEENDRRQLAQMSSRDKNWLSGHNRRRKKYHKKYRKSYVPLKWSPKLKQLSKKWAKHLANVCGRQGIYHDPNNRYGENLAANWGTGKWAKRPSIDQVLMRLVENEEYLGYPQNGHFTQVLWRGTKFVGCAEHTKIFRDGSGKKCHIQVCRYSKPGNCNMGNYQNYKIPMLADDSPCGPTV